MKKIMFFVMFALAIAVQAQAGQAYLKNPSAINSLDEAKVRYQAYLNAVESNDSTFFNIAPSVIKQSLISRWNARGYQPAMTDQNIFTILRDASKVELKSVTFAKGELKVGYVTAGKLSWWERANYGGSSGEWVLFVKQDPLNGEFVSMWCGNDLEKKVKKVGVTKNDTVYITNIDTFSYQTGAGTIIFNPTINVEVNPIIENHVSGGTDHLQERYSPFNYPPTPLPQAWQPDYGGYGYGGGDTYAPTRNVTISMFNGNGGGFGGGWNQGFVQNCPQRQICTQQQVFYGPRQPVAPVQPNPPVPAGGPLTGATNGSIGGSAHTGATHGITYTNGTVTGSGTGFTGSTTGRGNVTNVGTRPAGNTAGVTYNNSGTHNVTSRSGGTYQNANISRANTNYSSNRSIAMRR